MKKSILLLIITLILSSAAMAQSVSKNRVTQGKTALVGVVNVSAPVNSVEAGSNFTIPVAVSDTTGLGIIAYQFDLHFDPSVMQPQANPVETTGTLSGELAAVYNPNNPGILKVAVYGAYPLNGAGTLIKLNFRALGAEGRVSPVSWVNFMFNEGDPAANVSDGQISIASRPSTAIVDSFTGRESATAVIDQMNNIFRGNSFVMLSDNTANPTSLTVSFDMSPLPGQPGAYLIATGHWTMTVYEHGVYVGSVYGEVGEGTVTDLFDAAGNPSSRKIKALFKTVGGMGRFEDTVRETGATGEFRLRSNLITRKSTSSFSINL